MEPSVMGTVTVCNGRYNRLDYPAAKSRRFRGATAPVRRAVAAAFRRHRGPNRGGSCRAGGGGGGGGLRGADEGVWAVAVAAGD